MFQPNRSRVDNTNEAIHRHPYTHQETFETHPVFTVDDIFTETECQSLISVCKQKGFQNLDATFPQSYRQSSRVMIFSQKVARVLYQRVIPYFRPKDLNVVPIGFGRSGKWIPVRFNECLKVVRYEREGMIIPHQDGPWVPFEDQASIYTVVFYLNDDFGGGETLILPHGEIGRREVAFALADIGQPILPKTGKIAVFDHRVVHASKPIKYSTKYILRAELIFQKVYSPTRSLWNFFRSSSPSGDTGDGSPAAYLYSKDYIEARRLYDLSRKAELHGEKEEFVSQYEEVLRMQCYASSAANRLVKEQQENYHLSNGDLLCWKLVLHWISLKDISSLAITSKGLNQLLKENEVWQSLFVSRWGDQ
jgi:hypothetical protein